MKKQKLFFLLICLFLLSIGSEAQNTWTQKANVVGGRFGAAVFSIGGFGYMGTGNTSAGCTNDLWRYDPIADSWGQMASIPDSGRLGAVGFEIGAKGYIGTGYNANVIGGLFFSDLWEYDPLQNNWTQKSSMPVTRFDACSFVIGTKAYVIAGKNDTATLQDTWEWDSVTDTWTQKNNFGGGVRFEPSGFAIGNYGYAGLGSQNGVFCNDNWKYDPSTDTWTPCASFGGVGRAEAVTFTINGYAYVGTGLGNFNNGPLLLQDFWKYDPLTDTWFQLPNFSGAPRAEARGFAIGNKGYLGGGLSFMSDFWEFSSDLSAIMPAPESNTEITIYPNPVMTGNEYISLLSEQPVTGTLRLLDITGRELLATKLKNTRSETLFIGKLPAGIYAVIIHTGTNQVIRQLIITNG